MSGIKPGPHAPIRCQVCKPCQECHLCVVGVVGEPPVTNDQDKITVLARCEVDMNCHGVSCYIFVGSDFTLGRLHLF